MNEKRIFVIVFLTPRCTATVCVLAGPDFHSLFQYLGFRLSNRTFSALVMRYSSKNGNIEFGDFILCAIRMKTMLGKGNNSRVRERERESMPVCQMNFWLGLLTFCQFAGGWVWKRVQVASFT